MDYRFTDEEESFRAEVRTFLRSELPEDWDFDPFELTEDKWDFAREFTKKLAGKGWVAPAWPKEYGGQGMPYMKQVVLSEEIAYHRAPNTSLIGVTYAGPTIIVYGNDEQKKQFLPGITSGDIVWCQGYSEPNAGSDLASLQTRAVKDGDDYIINGTKIWSSNAHKANWCFFLARTDMDAPKHKGITYFMTPMDTPGISVRPLVNMADEHVFNEIVFDNVRVPVKYLVGEENRGWYIGMTTLDFERSNISTAAQYRRTFEQLVDYVKSGTNGTSGTNGNGVKAKLAELAIENQVGRYLSLRVASMQSRNQIPNYESSAAKVYHSEYGQRLAGAGLNILGLYGVLDEESKHARMRGRFARTYLTSLGSTIAAGTSEIQRGIIAQRGLGLSRI
ncbi:MAG TPA: acyl-CoA dehydrogenase family protein [Dehalococcoidia bacterium]|jgi:alkylation response protein AidB-like acyl-CoA dehydrogenase|nr:acyl-CoA dehydrogenase family protein [Dehalococcoidia bacterium]